MSTREQMAQGAEAPSADGPPKMVWDTPGQDVFGVVTLAKYGFKIPNSDGPGHLIEVADETRGPVTVWTTSAQLKAGIVEGRNQVQRQVQAGDTVYIRFDGKEQIDGGKTLNRFAINVQAGNGHAPQQQQAAPAQVAPPQQGFAPQQAPQYAAPQGATPF